MRTSQKSHFKIRKFGKSVEKRKNLLSPKKFRQINPIVFFFGKNVTFTEFLSKDYDSKFPYFPHCFHGKIFREIISLIKSKLTFTNFLSKKCKSPACPHLLVSFTRVRSKTHSTSSSFCIDD